MKKISNEDLINELYQLINELDRAPTLKEYDEKYHHRGMINSRFGSWNKFLSSLDVKPVQAYYEGAKCKAEGCNNAAKTNYLCSKHYAQYLRNNKILKRTRFTENEIIIKNDYAEIAIYDISNKIKDKVLIDKECVEKIEKYKIYTDNTGYATISLKESKTHLAEFLFGKIEDNKVYSYKNKNKLDCRSGNIIVVTRAELGRNQKLQKRNKTGVKGVYKNRHGKYQASIGHNRQKYYLGSFDTIEEAARARKTAEKKLWGKIYSEELE